MQVIRYHDVIEPVAIQIGDMQLSDLRVDGKNFVAAETKQVRRRDHGRRRQME